MKKAFLFILITVCSSIVFAQAVDYTGVWNGKFYNNTSFGLQEDTYRFEVQIAQTGKGIEGVTYSYLNTSFYGKAGHNGYVKTDGKKIVVQETKMIELKSMSGGACLMTCTMTYSKVGEEEFLEGTFTAIEANNGSPCDGGYVKLKKIKKSIFGIEPKVQKKLNDIAKKKANPSVIAKTTTPAKTSTAKTTTPVAKTVTKPPVTKTTTPPVVKTTPPVVKTVPPPVKDPIKKDVVVTSPAKGTTKKVDIPPPPQALVERKNELVKIIPVTDTNQIVLDFYDYGEVDGDIVTIYVNNKIVVNQQTLGTRPISVPIQLSEANSEVTVVMYANNLGSIPPNTAYMTVRVKGQKYEATIESTEQKNASVKFVYKGN